MSDATLNVLGNTQKADQVIIALEKKIDKLESKFRSSSRASRRASQSSMKGFRDVGNSIQSTAAKLGLMVSGYGALTSAATAYFNINKKNADLISETTRRLSENELKLQIQSGATPEQLEKQIPVIQKALLQTPSTDVVGGLQLSTQLVSSGFRDEDIKSGAALQTVLDLKAATNQFGEEMGDVKKSIQSVSQFRKALGDVSPGAASIRGTGGRLTQLFEGSDIQFGDLSNLAPKAAGLKSQGIGENTQLAAFSALVDVMGGELGATAFQQVSVGLRAAGTDKKAVRALDAVGLSPEDVDFIGEDFPQALKNLKAALSQVDEQTASNTLVGLFGKRASPAAATMLGLTGTIDERLGILEGGAFERNLDIFQNSRFSRQQRTKILKTMSARELDKRGGEVSFDEARDLIEVGGNINRLKHGSDAKVRYGFDLPYLGFDMPIGLEQAKELYRLEGRKSLGHQPFEREAFVDPKTGEAAPISPHLENLVNALREATAVQRESMFQQRRGKNIENRNAHRE